MKKVKLHDKEFEILIGSSAIDQAIGHIAQQMNNDLKNDAPIFLSILNGSFMFTSDLLKQITIPGTEVCFMKIASYEGTCSSGHIKELIGFNKDISNRTVVIVEDMIDSGKSMSYLLDYLKQKSPGNIKVATMFYKPKALICPVQIDYCAMELENDFVVGRGLDYDGLGRNLPDLYILSK